MRCYRKIQLPSFPPLLFVLIFSLTAQILLLFQKSFILAPRWEFYLNTFTLGCNFFFFLGKIFPGREIRNTSTYGLFRDLISVSLREKFGGHWAPVLLELGLFKALSKLGEQLQGRHWRDWIDSWQRAWRSDKALRQAGCQAKEMSRKSIRS